MPFEKPKFNKPENKEVRERKMSKAEKELKSESAKDRQRENRLQKIIAGLTDLLQKKFPEKVAEFEIIFEEISEREDTVIEPGSKMDILPSQSPAFGIFLILKSNPNKKFEIMHLFRQDVDKRVKNEDMDREYQIPYWGDRIGEGIEILKTRNKKSK